jgi:DNA-binding LacI/PurR family transcriptional regulator
MASATIRDVAKRAGVGIGTVSRVINNHPSVSEATRLAVESAIADLDFSPNPSARRLSSGKTLTIAVVAPFSTRPAFVERLRGVVTGLTETPYDLVVYDIETPERRNDYLRELPRRERFDGMLVIALWPNDVEAERLHSAVPTVLLDCSHPLLNSVAIDDIGGGYAATMHLIELGHRLIGYLSDSPQSPFGFMASRLRREGYLKALTEACIDVDPHYHVVTEEHGVQEARAIAHKLLHLPDPPSAVFAASDTQAIGVIQAAGDCGLRVPEDLSVIGYDDIELSEFLRLTTVHQPLFASGVEAAELLLDIIAQPKQPPREILLPVRVIVRQTTAASVHSSAHSLYQIDETGKACPTIHS